MVGDASSRKVPQQEMPVLMAQVILQTASVSGRWVARSRCSGAGEAADRSSFQ